MLELSTARATAKSYYSSGDFAISLKLKQPRRWSTAGSAATDESNCNHAGAGTFEIGPDKGGKVTVKADYQRKSFDFDVVVKGDVEAFRCVEKK